MVDVHEALDIIVNLNEKRPLRETITEMEAILTNSNTNSIRNLLSGATINSSIVNAAMVLKPKIGQLHEIIHAGGIIISLPHVLEPNEIIEYVSLAAGNTGKEFDLKTNRRIAEFKFITWRGGPEAIRQNSVFADFYELAESPLNLKKCLYLLGCDYALKFLQNDRNVTSVISKSPKVRKKFIEKYGDRYLRVSEYYAEKKDLVEIIDLKYIVPEFSQL